MSTTSPFHHLQHACCPPTIGGHKHRKKENKNGKTRAEVYSVWHSMWLCVMKWSSQSRCLKQPSMNVGSWYVFSSPFTTCTCCSNPIINGHRQNNEGLQCSYSILQETQRVQAGIAVVLLYTPGTTWGWNSRNLVTSPIFQIVASLNSVADRFNNIGNRLIKNTSKSIPVHKQA